MAGTDTSIFGVGEVQIPGPPGPAPELQVGTVTSSPTPVVTFTEVADGVYRVDYEIPNGPQGPSGVKGDKGDKGAKGDKGDKGDTGLIEQVMAGDGVAVDNTTANSPKVSIDPVYKEYLDALVKELVPGDYIVVDTEDSVTSPKVAVNITTLDPYIRRVRTEVNDPTVADIEEGTAQVWHNSSSGDTKLWANISGTLKSVELV